MTEKTALITGANKGIGFEIAKQLAARGYSVWIGARDPGRGEQAAAALRADGAEARFVELDVTDTESVTRAAATVAKDTDRLDVLVNNAGISREFNIAPSNLDIAVMEEIYDTNVFGPARVTHAFLPLVRKAPAGRIVMMSSGLGSLADQADPAGPYFAINLLAYNSSKAALNGMTICFAKELAGTSIKINAADPGFTATDMNAHRGTRSIPEGAQIAVHLATLPADGPTGGFFNDAGPVRW